MAASRLTSRRRQDQGSNWVRIAMAVLATVGVIDT
ncbi:thioredoxin, partial [Pseudomonas sp. HMWF031]